jgi:hypothetical protein
MGLRPTQGDEKHFHERPAKLQIPRLRDDKGEGGASMESSFSESHVFRQSVASWRDC